MYSSRRGDVLSSRLILAFLLSLTAAFLYAFALLTGYGTSAHSQNPVLMAVDADPQASGIQACAGNVSVGTSISVDFVIRDVPDIEGFGLRLLYDKTVVSVVSKDKSVSVLGSSGLDVGDSLPDADGSFLDGYVGEGASGSGILMRYTVRAKAAGLTWLHLVMGDVDTNYVDSALLTRMPDQTEDALVSVGAPCPQSLPPTPSPAPGETREAQTSSSPAPTSGPQGTPTTPWPTPPQGASQRASPAPVTPAAELQGTPSSGSQEVQRANTPAAAAQSGSDGGRAGTPGEGGGFPWFALAIGVAVAAGVGGVAVIYWRRIARRGS
jgi:hypothetical protein